MCIVDVQLTKLIHFLAAFCITVWTRITVIIEDAERYSRLLLGFLATVNTTLSKFSNTFQR